MIILHTDQQRYDSLGCSGNPLARTPHIDALASDGAAFSRHIAANPVCMPSRASLLTGLYVPGHRVTNNGIPLWRRTTGRTGNEQHQAVEDLIGSRVRGHVPTLADRLTDAGYYTSLMGKLHLEPHLADDRFEFTEAYNSWKNPEMEYWKGPYYGFQKVQLILGHGEAPCGYNRGHYGRWLLKNHPEAEEMVKPRQDADTMSSSDRGDIYLSKLPSELHHSLWLADEACKEIDAAADRDEPMFLFVGFPDPHHPFTPPEDAAQDFLDLECPEFSVRDERCEQKPSIVQETLKRNRASERDIETAYRYTAASVTLIDKAVGQITERLKEKGMYEDTIIIFTSDHGDFLGDFEMLAKDNLPFNALVHVPFILKPAGPSDLPKQIGTPMSNTDVVPTLMAMLGLDIPEDIQGIDIFSDDAEQNHPLCHCYGHHESKKNLTVYDERYRYTFFPLTGEEELYDHQNDLKEENNLAFEPDETTKTILQEKRTEVLEQHACLETGIYNLYSLW